MTSSQSGTDVDAVIIGAGFSGLYMLHRLRDTMGLTARVFETGGGVGGTWYWNRYPGARSDSDSYVYGFTFDEDLWQEWEWSERYPEQHEIRAYLEHVARRFDLYRDITFNTTIAGATFDEDTDTWTVTTDSGESVTARYVITGVGALSASNTPKFPGLDSFRGDTYHTGHWPHGRVDFTGKRVGIIGTGASAVQAIPLIAREASDLTVFQRTANYIIPARNGPVPDDVREARKGDYARHPGAHPELHLRLRAELVGEGGGVLDAGGGRRRAGAALGQGRFPHLARQLRRHVLRRRGERQGARLPAPQDPGDGARPGDRGAADPQGLSVRLQTQPARLRLLRDVQPAARAPGRRQGQPDRRDHHNRGEAVRRNASTSSTRSSTPPGSTR